MYQVRIMRGVIALDTRIGKHWVFHVDLDKLDMHDYYTCVLGQLYAPNGDDDGDNGYARGIEDLTGAGLIADASQDWYEGFDIPFSARMEASYKRLRAEWVNIIIALRLERDGE